MQTINISSKNSTNIVNQYLTIYGQILSEAVVEVQIVATTITQIRVILQKKKNDLDLAMIFRGKSGGGVKSYNIEMYFTCSALRKQHNNQ